MGLAPLKRVYVTVAWLAGQQKAHLCAASSIRAMPENEIPPVIRGDFYSFYGIGLLILCVEVLDQAEDIIGHALVSIQQLGVGVHVVIVHPLVGIS